MKKILFAVLFISAAAIIFQSCTKDEEMKHEKSLDLYSSADIDPIEAKILKFIERMDLVREDPDYAGSEDWNYSEDSTVWYIEAALNYDYTFPNESRSKLIKDSMYIKLDKLDNDNLNILEIQEKYDLTLDTLTLGFNEIESEHKFLVSGDYKVVSSNTESIEMIVYFYYGLFSSTLPDGDWVVTGGEYGNGGVCGTLTYLNFDGTNKLEQEIFNANPIHQVNAGFTNISNTTSQVANYIVIDQNYNYTPCEDWVLYLQIEWNANNMLTCLGINHMNVYEDNMVNTLNNYYQASQRSSIVVDIDWTFKLIQIGVEPYEHQYRPTITTGIAYPRVYYPKNTYYQ